MQVPSVLETGRGFPGACSEDCLYVNVWTPSVAVRPSGPLPVMVWVHGGSFVNGSGSLSWYAGEALAARGDVVVVTVNYRLGAFGFLDLSELGGPDFASSGNLGLLDQVAALGWVRDNIAAFGGDPQNVCLFGESAGAMSVGTILAAPPARGLFHRAIMQSGTPTALGRASSGRLAEDAFRRLDLPWSNAGLAQLGRLPAEQVLATSEAISLRQQTAAVSGGEGAFAWQPVVDGVTIPEHPNQAVAKGAASDVPVLIGTTADEMRIVRVLAPGQPPVEAEELLARVGASYGEESATVVAAYQSRDPTGSADDLWWALLSDQIFGLPTADFLDARGRRGAATWSYSFEWKSPTNGGAYGAAHTMEIPFVFDTFAAPGIAEFVGPYTPEIRELCAVVQDAWVRFATHGDPATVELAEWRPNLSDPSSTMLLGTPTPTGASCSFGPDPRRPARDILRPR